MSDSSAYINTYIDNAVGMVHDYVNQILQLKTENKIATGLIKQKDETIATLQEELNNCKSESADWHKNADSADSELNKQKNDFLKLENEYNALKSKASHMDTLASQLTNSNHELAKRNNEIQELNRKITELSDKLTNVSNDLATKTNEINQLTNDIKVKDDTIENLNAELAKKSESPSSPKVINNKGKPKGKPEKIPEPEETDDF